MEIPETLINEITKNIYEKFESVYIEYIQEKREPSFQYYLETVMQETLDELYNLIDITDDFLMQIKQKRLLNKKRWVKKELEDVEDDNLRIGFNKKVLLTARLFYEDFGQNEIACLSAYGHKTFEEYKQFKIDELNKWRDNPDAFVSDYLYLESKKWNQIEISLKNDIRYLIIKTIKEQKPKELEHEIISMPNSMTKVPYDWSNKAQLKDTNIVKLSKDGIEGDYFRDIRMLDDTTILESYLAVESLREGLLKESFKTLNATDQSVFLYLMSIKNEEFYRTGKMVVRIGDIVRGLKLTDGKKNYTAIKQSIIKMRFLDTSVIDKNLRMVNVSIFLSAQILTEDELDEVDSLNIINGKEQQDGLNKKKKKIEFAVIHFSDDLVKEIVKNETTSVYKDIINQFSSKASQLLIYPLQGERIACWKANPDSEELVFNVNLTYFKTRILFTTNRRDRQIKIIKEGLDEIMKCNFIIKDYEQKGDNFKIIFYPLSMKEQEDLLDTNTPIKLIESY